MITFLKKLASAITTPAAGKVTFFVDSTDGLPKYKDETGALGDFAGPPGPQGDVGPTGPSGRVPSIQSVVSSATVTPTFSDDLVKITAQAAALFFANPTGTAIPGLGMVIRIKDDGTARTITYDTQYRAIGISLPTTTVIGKTTYIAMIFNSDDTKWDVLAVGIEA